MWQEATIENRTDSKARAAAGGCALVLNGCFARACRLCPVLIKNAAVCSLGVQSGVELTVQMERTGEIRTIHFGPDFDELECPTLKMRNTFDDPDGTNPSAAEPLGALAVADLITLPYLNEPAILDALRMRTDAGLVYTNVGTILLAINPFKPLPQLYSTKALHEYRVNGAARAGAPDSTTALPPHVYAVAEAAYRSMRSSMVDRASGGGAAGEIKADQSILVSGESGAGKTETTKILMQYLAVVSSRETGSDAAARGSVSSRRPKSASGSEAVQAMGVERRVLESNPILESFGNARTIRNDNSSRFGKWIEIQFDGRGRLVGAAIRTYLLEKVRLVWQAPDERCYHIFYEMIAGASDENFDKWKLIECDDVTALNQSGCIARRDGVDDSEQLASTMEAVKVMGFSDASFEQTMAMLSALLRLGNLSFDERECDDNVNAATVADVSRPDVEIIAGQLGLDADRFAQTLCVRTVEAEGREMTLAVSAERALNVTRSLVKAMYSKVFDWIVATINLSCGQQAPSNGAQPSRGARGGRGGNGSSEAFIGILDIFGFEVFATNSFEQLMINYTNERMQKNFNDFIFKLEQKEYNEQGISWSFVEFPDNSAVLDLIEGRNGLLKVRAVMV